eukprot:2074041-Rhodomonas_salina.1
MARRLAGAGGERGPDHAAAGEHAVAAHRQLQPPPAGARRRAHRRHACRLWRRGPHVTRTCSRRLRSG